MLKAIVEWELGRKDSAYRSLHEALTLVQTYDYCRIFLDEKRAHRIIEEYAGWRIDKKNGGEKPVSADYLNKLLSLLPRDTHEGQSIGLNCYPNELTTREREIVRCVARGLSNKQIAGTLMISLRTVSTHLENIYKKLNVHSRTEMIAKLNRSTRETDPYMVTD